ncbi:Membrane protein [hydrothermal vent metagenome]|uniref:Membrane protein n=1 Tax=hydrothermal vent metagenome TaxID=652676 RepID=A0A3B0YU71_9ZZZZ
MINKPIIKASVWMLITLMAFSVLAVSVKESATYLGTAEILFFRSLIGLIIISIVIFFTGLKQIKTNNIKKHVLRNGTHFLGQYGWFYGIAYIPLAEVFALEFTVPIWTAIAAAILLNETVTKTRFLSIILGLIGVLVILRPSSNIIHHAAIVVLVGAIAYGLSHTLTRSIVKHDSPLSIIFYMCLMQLPIGFLLSLNSWVSPTLTTFLWLLLVAITALIAHYALSKALTYADATVVIPMDFLRLPVIMVVGLYFYQESFEWLLLLGGLIMLLGNYLNLRKEYKNSDT